jgi:hypothetical protein
MHMPKAGGWHVRALPVVSYEALMDLKSNREVSIIGLEVRTHLLRGARYLLEK